MIRLTNSEMKDWRRCRRKWWLSSHRGLQKRGTEEFNKPLSIGSRVHDVLAEYYQPGNVRRDPMQFFWGGVLADIVEHPAQEKEILKEADLCEAMLEGYFEWLEDEGADMDLEVIEPESEMEVPLVVAEDGVTLHASLLSKIDARVRSRETGKHSAIEHKTTQSLTDPIRRLQVDTQLLTEHLVEFMDLLEKGDDPEDNRAQSVWYNMLRKVKRTASAKPPFYGREEVQHSITELRNHWIHVRQQADEILRMHQLLDEGGDHHVLCYPNPTKDCTWDCEYREPCLGGMFDDGSDVEGYLADQFETGDPLARYRKASGLSVNHQDGQAESAREPDSSNASDQS